MQISHLPKQWPFSIFVALHCLATGTVSAVSSSVEDLDKAILNDIIQSYTTHEPTQCNMPEQVVTTSFNFTWPGAIQLMKNAFVPFEPGLFQAIMWLDNTGNQSWSIGIGKGGNMYSLIHPNAHEDISSTQENLDAPWIDEVRKSVAVPRYLNNNRNCFDHQAGAYQQDNNYTTKPFYSPSLAKWQNTARVTHASSHRWGCRHMFLITSRHP
jgi:hypothetical protein